jgi:hypothetical protein
MIRVPAGMTVRRVTYTAINLGLRETYKVYQDSPAGAYTTDTAVNTKTTPKVPVTVLTRLNSVFAKTISGFSDQHLILTVTKLQSDGLR